MIFKQKTTNTPQQQLCIVLAYGKMAEPKQ